MPFLNKLVFKVNSLIEEKALKEKILQTSGMSQNTITTKYIADIGNVTPNSITLKTIYVNPLAKKIKPDTKINFIFNVVNITGISTNDEAFNNWIKKVKEFNWVKKIEITDYYQESNIANSFSVKINI